MPDAVTLVDPAFVPAPAPAAHAVEVGNEAVVLDEATGRLHLLNPTAALLWACFDGVSSLGEICADVADALGVPLGTVLTDSRAAVDQFVEQRVVYDGRGPAPAWQRPDEEPAVGVIEEPPNP